MAEDPKRMLEGARLQAEQYARDRQKAERLLDDAMRKAEHQEGRLKRIWTDLMALVRLARAWSKGTYRQVPWKSMVLILAAIIYFLNPMDLIPDVVLALGYVDDATVIAWVLRSVRKDMERFAAWEAQQAAARS